jgi:ankyrin repeat protein
VELGCDTVIKDKCGRTGKQWAEREGHAAVLDILRTAAAARLRVSMALDQPELAEATAADANAAAGGSAEGIAAGTHPPLLDVAARGELAELEALLAAGADTEARDAENGRTAFLRACIMGQLECAQALAAAGCDVAAASSIGSTALMAAANKGHAAVVAWLLGEGGAAGTLETRDEYGYTALIAMLH